MRNKTNFEKGWSDCLKTKRTAKTESTTEMLGSRVFMATFNYISNCIVAVSFNEVPGINH